MQSFKKKLKLFIISTVSWRLLAYLLIYTLPLPAKNWAQRTLVCICTAELLP